MHQLGEWLREHVAPWGLSLSAGQLDQFQQYYRHLIKTNEVMNLTSITDEREVYIKHFYDSLTLSQAIDLSQVKTLVDVGTGAGFPGIPLKIAFPHLKLTLLDSLKKRVGFLQEVVDRLKLDSVTCVHGRAEELAKQKDFREAFDLATARAVARLNVLAEYCLPFVKVGGFFVSMKGSSVEEEIDEAQRSLHILGKTTCQRKELVLPEAKGTRNLIIMQKRDHTPKAYPRKAGTPSKHPLI